MNKSYTAVVVNDDRTQLEILSGLLKKTGLEVMAFDDAGVALEAMQGRETPTLIVTDLHMPGIDGWKFCRLLRTPEYERFNEVPIIVVSATFAGDHVEQITSELGANAFLPIPLAPGRFVGEVRRVLKGESVRTIPGVLIVDDDTDCARELAEAFRTHGYNAVTAAGGAEAIQQLMQHPSDIVVIKDRLPDRRGAELMLELSELRPMTAFILNTDDFSPQLAVEWMQQGAAAYVRRPFDPRYLLTLCDRIRRESALMRVEELLEERTVQLQRREEEFRLIVDNQTELICKWLPDLTLVFVNDAFCRYFGRSRKQILGSRLSRFLPAADHERFVDHVTPPHEGKPQVVVHELEVQDNEGEMRWQQWVNKPIVDETGQLLEFLSVGRDITERKRYERELKRLSEAMRQTHEAVLITDTDGVIEYVNPAFEALTGYRADDALGRKPDMLKSGKQNALFYSELWETIKAGRVWSGQFVNRRSDGSLYTEACSISPVKKHDGTIEKFVALKRDISREQELEEHIHLVQKLETVGRLAAGVAHDINNFLLPILGYSELLMDNCEPYSKEYEQLEHIRGAAIRSRDLIRQLLAFGRRQLLDVRALDVCEIISDITRLLRKMIRENIEITIALGEGAFFVQADRSQIGQVLLNLAINAQDAMADGGRLTFAVSAVEIDDAYCAMHRGSSPGRYVLITVSDTGHGMDAEIIPRIFDPFFTTKGHLGTGLGLSTVYGIVKQHGGNVWAYSEPGRGSVFKVYLPCADRPQEAEEEEAKIPVRGGEETVLVVEDDEMVRDVVCDFLSDFGYRVLSAADGQEALETAGRHQGTIHLLLSDVVMPRMDGPDVYDRILHDHPGIKVIFTSGYAEDARACSGIVRKNCEFVQKPFSVNMLARKVRDLLDG